MYWDKDYDDKGKTHLKVAGQLFICQGCSWYMQFQGTREYYCENCDFCMMDERKVKELDFRFFQCLKCDRICYQDVPIKDKRRFKGLIKKHKSVRCKV
jgi:hypothetical protein